ncbi:MAG: DUF373 family protein [Thermoplasmata archaeon]|nr:MAG: DUF373 family protein [Thermoplasmata archaeon]
MRLLIICVDRDNDLGTKVGIESPVIGREACLSAAVTLGLADPEESDTNSIFSGIFVYDSYIKNGVDTEIAVICGDSDVGIKSDQVLANQIDLLLSKVEADSAILVSDGAEDEHIYPILQSRIKIDGIKRVVVRQARNIESIYYMFLRSFQEERVRRKFILPLALALIVFSTFSILTVIIKIYDKNFPEITLPVVFLTIGIYIVVKAYNLDEPLKVMSQDAKSAISTIPFILLSGIIIVAGILAGWNAIQGITDPVLQMITLIEPLLWAGVFAVILLGIGRALHIYIREAEFPWIFFPIVFSILAFGSFLYCALKISSFFFGMAGTEIVDDIFIFLVTGIIFTSFGYFSLGKIRQVEKTADWHH